MRKSKQYPKNKNEINSFSGVKKKRKKIIPYHKPTVEFEFTFEEKVYKNGTGRIKITTEGGIQCLIQTNEGVWTGVKGHVNFIRLKKVTNVVIPKKTLPTTRLRKNKGRVLRVPV
jgi:hypothetical protein